MAAKLRSIMPTEHHEWPTLEAAANRFAMSTRTLIRKLAAEELFYQALLDEAKGELACWYLRNTSIPISGVAERLGFLSDANFSRSFKRWRGTTAMDYRKSHLALRE